MAVGVVTRALVLIALGLVAWLGLAVCFAVAIGLSIRAAEQQRPRPTLRLVPPLDKERAS